MDDATRKSAKAGEEAAEGLREAADKEEAKIERETRHDIASACP